MAPRSSAASSSAGIEALQPGQHQQHDVGGDEGDLAEHGQMQAGRDAELFQNSRVEMPITAPGVRIGATIRP